MRILGIDPGYALMGYGLVDRDSRGRFTVVDYGVVETTSDEPLPERLERLYTGTRQLIEMYSPECAVFEELFFYRNTTTAIAVGAGRGVALLAAQQKRLPLYEYTPMQIKLADKTQVQHMVRLLLNLQKTPKPDDAADALAAAICHGSTMGPAAEEYRIH